MVGVVLWERCLISLVQERRGLGGGGGDIIYGFPFWEVLFSLDYFDVKRVYKSNKSIQCIC